MRPVFVDWLERNEPLKAEKVQSLIRATRGGKLNDAKFGSRMRGQGLIADQIKQTFQVFARRVWAGCAEGPAGGEPFPAAAAKHRADATFLMPAAERGKLNGLAHSRGNWPNRSVSTQRYASAILPAVAAIPCCCVAAAMADSPAVALHGPARASTIASANSS